MIRSRLGLKALVLSALVLSLMAFVTSGVAQATAGAKWTYIDPADGKLKTFTKTLLPEINGVLETDAVLHFTTAGGTKVLFKCTAFSLEGKPLLLENGSISEGQATFTGCETFLNESATPSKACLPKTNKGPNDQIQTNKATGLLELHKLISDGKLDHVTRLTPVTKDAKGNPLAATLELGEECSIGASVPITGSLVVYDCPASKVTILEHAEKHLIEEFPALRLLKALGQEATVLGSAFAFLAGVHKGFKWAGLTA